MRRIIRLYPKAWRERYGEEMDAVLDERAAGPYEVADLLLGALDAHLHLRGLGNRSESRKGITMSLRTAGIAAIIGGALWGLAMLWMLLAELTGQSDEQPLAFFAIIASTAALLVGFAGLSAFQARTHPKAVWASFAMAAVGFVMVIAGWGGMMIIEGLYWVGMVGVLAIFAGSIAFGAVTSMTDGLSRAGGVLLVIGPAAQLLGFALVAMNGFNGPTPGSQLLLIVGGLGFAGGWLALGVDAVRRDRLPVAMDQPAA